LAKGGSKSRDLASVAGSAEQQQEKAVEEAQRRSLMLVQILSNEARERLSRIHLVKPEKARQVEDMCIYYMRSGRLREKVSEHQLIQMLDSIEPGHEEPSKVIVSRRQDVDGDDDLDLDQYNF
jgi:programmed cell death protein 5